MMQQIDYYINQQKQFSNVDGYACLNDFFDKLSYLNYSVVINSLPFPNDLMLIIYLYDNVEPLNGWTDDTYNSFGDIRCKYCFELFWGSNKNLRINFYETNYVLGISRYVYRYRSSAMNNWISQHSYTSSVPSNSELIR